MLIYYYDLWSEVFLHIFIFIIIIHVIITHVDVVVDVVLASFAVYQSANIAVQSNC